MKNILQFTIAAIVLGLLAACAAPTPAPTAPPTTAAAASSFQVRPGEEKLAGFVAAFFAFREIGGNIGANAAGGRVFVRFAEYLSNTVIAFPLKTFPPNRILHAFCSVFIWVSSFDARIESAKEEPMKRF